jgi:hypothetical protein
MLPRPPVSIYLHGYRHVQIHTKHAPVPINIHTYTNRYPSTGSSAHWRRGDTCREGRPTLLTHLQTLTAPRPWADREASGSSSFLKSE